MERQFNARYGAKPKIFDRGRTVYVSDYKDGKHKWISGSILDRVGKVFYKNLVILLKLKGQAHFVSQKAVNKQSGTLQFFSDSALP
ncbi:unnamed protein product [Heligmosomoides polygyrus]|uniref:DDE_Tnp_1_7 domain-containing protein n=1 Tax=Heligmosomoides polygyrus TaxID=6339 RepID=A0A3P8AA93_HELPZ|nr:unnamed protein product [Heligmosomoides polygyrus]